MDCGRNLVLYTLNQHLLSAFTITHLKESTVSSLDAIIDLVCTFRDGTFTPSSLKICIYFESHVDLKEFQDAAHQIWIALIIKNHKSDLPV
jgi:hypothetical protein